MDLLEYQAKELFRQTGIPVLPSQRIDQPKDLKGLKIPYPVVLKSQVYTGGRGKAGGIKFVANTIDAVAAAQTIFHLPIMGKYPKVLLAEAKYDAEREFYLAVVLDGSTRRPILLGSQYGGIEVEAKLEKMQQVVVEQAFSPFYARRLALKMGLEGPLICSVSSMIEKMYRLFTEQDLDLIEINPLAVSSTGELMALDGKVVVNDEAIARHPALSALMSFMPTAAEQSDASGVHLVGLEGTVGLISSGAGLTMATLDLIHKAKGKPAGFVDVGGEYRYNCPPSTLQARIEQGLLLMAEQRAIKVILVNILSGSMSCLHVAEAIATHLKRNPASPPLVVRLVGEQSEQAKQMLEALDITVLDQLDDAITHSVALTKARLS